MLMFRSVFRFSEELERNQLTLKDFLDFFFHELVLITGVPALLASQIGGWVDPHFELHDFVEAAASRLAKAYLKEK